MKVVFLTVQDNPLTAWWIEKTAEKTEVSAVVASRLKRKTDASLIARKVKRDWKYIKNSSNGLDAIKRTLILLLALPLMPLGMILRKVILDDNKVYEKLGIRSDQYEKLKKSCNVIEVGEINSARTIEIIKGLNADLILDAGTAILSNDTIEEAGCPIVNIHTGLTQYYRGVGSTFAAVAEGNFDKIGFTVHRIDPGIDTGPVMEYYRIPVFSEDRFSDILSRIYAKVPDGYSNAVRLFEKRKGNFRYKDGGKGKLFLSSSRVYHDPAVDIIALWLRMLTRRISGKLRERIPDAFKIARLINRMKGSSQGTIVAERVVEPDDFRKGSLLVLAPHPDDGLIGCWGLARWWKKKGNGPVVFANISAGETSRAVSFLPEPLNLEARRKAFDTISTRMHLDVVRWLNHRYPEVDIEVGENGISLEEKLKELVDEFTPTVIAVTHWDDLNDHHVMTNASLHKVLKDNKTLLPDTCVLAYETNRHFDVNFRLETTKDILNEKIELMLYLEKEKEKNGGKFYDWSNYLRALNKFRRGEAYVLKTIEEYAKLQFSALEKRNIIAGQD